jgi:predicted dehydrogenase
VNYEEKGIDYPAGYVRWTEKRNMQAFQHLIHSGKIDIDYLTTHVFDVDDARKAYDLILNKEDLYLGILIKYDVKEAVLTRKIETKQRILSGKVNIAFVGVGSYAQSFLLPNISKNKEVVFKAVHDSSGTVSKKVAEKFGFEYCTSNVEEILANEEVNTVYVATRHNSHADYVSRSLRAGKNIHVEKPLCLNETELEAVKAAYGESQKSHAPPILLVGFNRRFSPLTEVLKKRIGDGPMAMIYRINSGKIPSDYWVQDPEIGGGRIVGEVCHFVDFLTYINGSLPDRIFAQVLPQPGDNEDTVNVNLKFQNGSIGTISYFSNGAKSLLKEYIEIYRAGITGIIRDFKELVIYEDGKTYKKKLISQDKGQKRMIDTFITAVKEGKPSPIDFADIHAVMLTTFRIIESLRSNEALPLISE